MKTETRTVPRTHRLSILTGFTAGALLLATATASNAEAEASGQKHFKGTLTEVDPANRTLTGKGFWFWSSPTFNVGEKCLILVEDKEQASLADLRPGQRVQVRYRTVSGVKVASQITENNPTFDGHITELDAEAGRFIVRSGIKRKTFIAAPECRVLERNERPARLSDLKLGHRVTVTYLDVGPTNLAAKIEQTSQVASGTLEAIDGDTRVIRTRRLAAEHKFTLADPCMIVLGGSAEGGIGDLRLGDELVVHYETIDGVQVANRIELPAQSTPEQDARSRADRGETSEP